MYLIESLWKWIITQSLLQYQVFKLCFDGNKCCAYIFKCFSNVSVNKVCVCSCTCAWEHAYTCVFMHARVGYSWSLSVFGAVIHYSRLVDIKNRNSFLTILESLGSKCWVGVSSKAPCCSQSSSCFLSWYEGLRTPLGSLDEESNQVLMISSSLQVPTLFMFQLRSLEAHKDLAYEYSVINGSLLRLFSGFSLYDRHVGKLWVQWSGGLPQSQSAPRCHDFSAFYASSRPPPWQYLLSLLQTE